APEFTLPDLTGKNVALNAYRGKKLMLQFWTAESSACIENLQQLESRTSRWKQAGLELLSVNTDRPGNSGSLSALRKKQSLSFPVLRATDDMAGTYNVLFRYLFD